MTIDRRGPGRGSQRTRPRWRRVAHPTVIRRASRIAVLTVAMVVAAFGIAACDNSTQPSKKTATVTNVELKMARCMRADGVPNFPDPTTGNGGALSVYSPGPGDTETVNGVAVNAPAFQSAVAKCQKYMPTGHVSANRFAKISEGALAMAKCMRSHKVPDFPDPVVSDGPQGLIVTGNLKAADININAPAFQAALRHCQPLEGIPAPVPG